MEDDSNLIACLFPAERENNDKFAWDAIRKYEKTERYIAPQTKIEREQGSRESTVEDTSDGVYDATSGPGLRLTFSPGPKSGEGLVFGTDQNSCDIVLPRLPQISRRHCCLTFDAKRRLILRVLSKCGTIVEYDDQGGEKRQTIVTSDENGRKKHHYFTWILSGEEVPDKAERILIKIQDLRFQIIVSKHKINSPLYIKNVDEFRLQADTNGQLPLGALGIQSTSTTANQSGAQTPHSQSQPPVYIRRGKLGSGSFSIVHRVWDVSTGFHYAAKEFWNMSETGWKKEVSIMKRVSQLSNHIVQFVGLLERPSPQLILEYLPLGNLENENMKRDITYQETLVLLCQCLDALTSVHEEGIVHRDIKPENILVHSRNPLHIKLSDFGLSKETPDLKTFCGTPLYAAPEIYEIHHGTRKDYTKACDIYSLGVVVFQYAHGSLPHFYDEDRRGLRWCEKIIKSLNDWDSEPLSDLLSTAMIVREPGKRRPARDCWEQALKLSHSRCATPTQASFSASDCLEKTPNLHPAATSTEAATIILPRSKRVRSEEDNLDPFKPKHVHPADLFRSNRSRGQHSIKSRVSDESKSAPLLSKSSTVRKRLRVDENLERNVRDLLAERIDENNSSSPPAIIALEGSPEELNLTEPAGTMISDTRLNQDRLLDMPSAKISFYKSKDYQPRGTQLDEFKPNLNPSLKTISPYESFT